MYPELTLSLFGRTILASSYSVMAAVGAAAAIVIAVPFLRRAGLSVRVSLGLLLMTAASFLIGARVLNFIVNRQVYGGALQLYSLRLAGFSLYGGLLGALGAVLLWARLTRRSPLPVLDTFVLPTAAAFVSARTGCYLNGCCAGKATDSWLGVVFPVKPGSEGVVSAALQFLPGKEIAVYPTQLFEAGLAILGLIPALSVYFREKRAPGSAFLVYGIWFCAMRLAVLPLRNLSYPDIVVKVVYPTLYAALIGVGTVLLIAINRNRAQTATTAQDIRRMD